MIGALVGDIVGSRFEFDNILVKDFEFWHPECCFTDDSVMTLAVAYTMMHKDGFIGKDSDKSLETMAKEDLHSVGYNYPMCGYGQQFIKWMYEKDPKKWVPYDSMGNGSAMRVAPVAWACDSLDEVIEASRIVSAITHDHPEGIKGGESTAVGIWVLRNGASKQEFADLMSKEYYWIPKSVDDIRKDFWHNELSPFTVPQAVRCFLDSDSFEDCIRNCISIGGDSDTIADIGGAFAEAYYGLPEGFEDKVRGYLDYDLNKILDKWDEYANAKCIK